MEINIIGNVIELSREQWKGYVAKITNDYKLLEEVKKYTWTYKEGEHPYLPNRNFRRINKSVVLSKLR